MAEQTAKNKKVAAHDRLQLALNTLTTVVGAAAGERTEASLRRHLGVARSKWEAYDQAHFGYVEKIQVEADRQVEREAYTASYGDSEALMERAEVMLDGYAAAQAPQVDNNILFTIARQEQSAFYSKAKDLVATVETVLGAEEGAKSRLELEELSNELKRVEEQMAAGALLTKEMAKLRPAEAEDILRGEADTSLQLQQSLMGHRRVIATRLSAVKAPEEMGRNNGNRGINDTYMYKRRDKPTFDGQRRNYPSWKREWQDGISGNLPENSEVREIKLHLPGEVEPDIKNLTTMKEVWGILDARYGKAMELTQELISGLQCFRFSKQAVNNSAKFLELYREFVKVYNDLQQIDSLSVLDHDPTLCTLAKQLPSDDSKMRYAQLRILRLAENDRAREAAAASGNAPVGVVSNLDIINEFMRKEREIQVCYEQLLSKSDNKAKPEDKIADRGGKWELRCFKCDKPGHRERDCHEGGRRVPTAANNCYRCNKPGHRPFECDSEEEWSGQGNGQDYLSHANTREKPKDCPACRQQHTFPGSDGQRRYRCRLSSCETFQDMSVNERARLMEEINGCVLCTDWTGSHTRDHCEEKTTKGNRFRNCWVAAAGGGGECGKKHHSLLHGSSSKFSNFLSVNMVSKDGRRVPPTEQDPGIKANVMRENPQAHALGKKNAFRVVNSSSHKIHEANRVHKLKDFNFSECEEMGTTQPRRCGAYWQQRSEAKVQLSRKEHKELTLIESNMVLGGEQMQARMRYPYIKEPSGDNGKQVATAKNLELRLRKAGQLDTYNNEMQGCVLKGAFGVSSEEEMGSSAGVVNHINHLDVPKPGSTTAEAGVEIDPAAAGDMINLGYVDDGVGGGDQATVDRLVGEEGWVDDKPAYNGTVQKILAKGSFVVEVMMQSGEVRKEVIDMLGGSVLGTPWATGADEIIMHIGVNFSPGNPCFFPRKRGVRVEPELTKDDLWLSNAAGDWDEELSEELSKEGRLVLKEMVLAPDIAIPRSFRPSGDKEGLELGGFWHGGDPASSGCVYSCHENTKQDWILEQIHEVRLMYYDNEVKRTYQLCFLLEVTRSRNDIVRAVKVGFWPRRQCGPGKLKAVPLEGMTVAVQRLVLLVNSEAGKQPGDGETKESDE